MHIWPILAPAAAAILVPAAEMRPVPVHVGGRVLPEQDGSLSFGWPGTYFEARFIGPAIRLRFDAPQEHMRLLIDGEQKALFQRPGKVDVTIGGLPAGEHIARLEKLTESQTGGGRFDGFFVPQDAHPLPPNVRERRIEFIGDSYTVGYGNRSQSRECSQKQIHDLTDTQQAFGPLLAKRLDADYRINAYSGFGIVRNYNGGSPELSLPAIYPRLKPDTEASSGAAEAWQPQVIVINLGTNDFSTPLNAGERWKSEAELKRAYHDAYVAFVGGLRRKHPNASFILMGSDQFIGDVREAARTLNRGAARPVHLVHFSGLDLGGCDWHPSLADNRLLANLLEKQIEAIDPW